MTNLTPVQREALRRSAGKRGYGYFMDMGLGKTLVALSEFKQQAWRFGANGKLDPQRPTRLVVICPNSFKTGWVAEIEKHGFNFATHVVRSADTKGMMKFATVPAFDSLPVLIVHYEAIRIERIRQVILQFVKGRSAMLVLDESIALKNPRAKQTKGVFALFPFFNVVRLLTGRPMTQGAHDLWGQLRVIGAEPRRNYYAFRNTFCRMGGWQNKEVVGSMNEDLLQQQMAPFTFQAAKADWLAGLPDKVYTARTYRLSDDLHRHYKEMENLFLTWLEDEKKAGKRVEATIALTKYLKLSQIMCGFIHDEDSQPRRLVPDDMNPRLQLLRETLEEATGKVCVVFRHRFVGAQLENALAAYHPTMIIGGMKPADIDAAKATFNDDPKCRVILLQQQASKFGHTLLGDQSNGHDACSTMIFYENGYSLDDRAQIEDRIHRMGQQAQSCLYVDLAGTDMDMRVVRALQHKQNVYDAVMGGRR